VIAVPGRHQGDELAQGEERDHREEQHRAKAAGQQRQSEDGAHDPPGSDAGVEVRDGRPPRIARHAPGKDGTDDAGDDEDTKHTGGQPEQLSVEHVTHDG
jgi:hypothetical protein